MNEVTFPEQIIFSSGKNLLPKCDYVSAAKIGFKLIAVRDFVVFPLFGEAPFSNFLFLLLLTWYM